MTRRACKGTTRKGTACQANPQRERDWCRAHDPDLPESARFGSPEQAKEAAKLAGRPRVPRVTELRNKWVEEHAEEIVAKWGELLDANRTVVVGNGPSAYTETVPDPAVQLRALQDIADRTEGRARQAVELTGQDGEPIEISTPDLADPEVRKLAHELVRRMAAGDGA